ncbi:MAG: radical SAM protein [Desulfobacteraceae bacterium]|nr:radical SAM protein [Desulfobacteraceae bacterium]
MKYCFGPVPSRRLGLSLGVDILPLKTCNLNCIYCELGPGAKYTCERGDYAPVELIKRDLESAVSGAGEFDTLTFTASGEPTLHLRLGEMLSFAKTLTDRPLAVLTNATLLSDPAVREELAQADILLPSLDSVIPGRFRKINRPAPCVRIEGVIDGLIKLKKETGAVMWLEVLFVRGVNDLDEDVVALKEAIAAIRPDKVQINTVSRPPAERWPAPVSEERLYEIRRKLGCTAEVIADFKRPPLPENTGAATEAGIVNILIRRPLTFEDILIFTGMDAGMLKETLEGMERSGTIKCKVFDDRPFYFPCDRVE